MAFNQKFTQDSEEIKRLISQKNIIGSGNALEKFAVYLEEIKTLGPFNSIDWDFNWRQSIYEFGRLFQQNDAGPFLELVIEKIKSASRQEVEVLNFVESEITWNFFSDKSYVGSRLKLLCKEYSSNPEFHQTYSHYLQQNANLDKAVSEAQFALKLEPNNAGLLNNYFNKQKAYFDQLLRNAQFPTALSVLEQTQIFLKTDYPEDYYYFNLVVGWRDRVNDHQIIQERIAAGSKSIDMKVEEVQGRFIEIIGVFSAVIGFILTTINIASSGATLSAFEKWALISDIALVLMIFTISLSYIFTDRKQKRFWAFLNDRKFWALVLLMVILCVIGIIEFSKS